MGENAVSRLLRCTYAKSGLGEIGKRWQVAASSGKRRQAVARAGKQWQEVASGGKRRQVVASGGTHPSLAPAARNARQRRLSRSRHVGIGMAPGVAIRRDHLDPPPHLPYKSWFPADGESEMAMQTEMIKATDKYLMPNYGPRLLAVVRGKGSRIWDADGKEYIDFFAGFGAGGAVGHCHPAVVAAVQEQAETLMSHGNFFTSQPQIELARRITEHAFGGKAFFGHSGADANEAALKLTRLATPKGRYKIISFNGCFHGRTMGALSLTPAKYQEGFEPMLPGNVQVDYGDLDAVRAAIDDETAGVFVEPIQGEGGVNVPSVEFMQRLRKLCDDNGILLVCDEVWTAPARTGKWFAYQHFGITPDVMTLGKAVGGGAPVGVCVAAPKWADVLGPGKHASTMGGNPLCASAGAAAMKVIEDEKLVERAAARASSRRWAAWGVFISDTWRAPKISVVPCDSAKVFALDQVFFHQHMKPPMYCGSVHAGKLRKFVYCARCAHQQPQHVHDL